MRSRNKMKRAIGAAVLLAGAMSASVHAAGSEGSGDGVPVPPLPHVYPGTVALRWTIDVPSVTIEQRELAFKAPSLITRAERWNYSGPVVRTERRKIGSYPDFSCKYVDWTVSNECTTVWRAIYADLPRVVVRPQRAVVEVPHWHLETWTLPVALPRWTWNEEHWSVSLPAFAPEAVSFP